MNIIDWPALVAIDWQAVSVRWMLTLLHFLWQGAAVGAVLAIALRGMRSASSGSRYWVSCASLTCLPIMAAVTFTLVDVPPALEGVSEAETEMALTSMSASATPSGSTKMPPGDAFAEPTAAHHPVPPSRTPISDTSPIAEEIRWTEAGPPPWMISLRRFAPRLTTVYAAVVTILLLRLLMSVWSGYRLRLSAQPSDDDHLITVVARLAQQCGLKVAPAVAYCERVAVPAVVGMLKPTVLLPASLVTNLTSDELAAILAHELAHIRRFDHAINLCQRVVESLLFFHPVVWWISHRVSTERELCCDDVAVASGHGHIQYAGALLRMAELCVQTGGRRLAGQIAALSAAGTDPSELSHRIERLLHMHRTPRLALSRLLSLPLAGVLVLAVASLLSISVLGQHQAASSDDTEAKPETAELPVESTIIQAEVDDNAPTASPTWTADGQPRGEDGDATVAGRIVLEDGSPAPEAAQGEMAYDSRLANGNGYSGNAGHFSNRFSFSVPAGRIWLSHYPQGYAPVWAGPLELKRGEKRDDITLVLKPGFSARVRAKNEQGKPIAGATLVVHPEINGKATGFVFPKQMNEHGEYQLEHLANTRYAFRITAPGYQPLRTEPLQVTAGQDVELTMIRSKPASGVIRNADGTPAVGAKLRAVTETLEQGPQHGFASGGDGFWGSVFTITDAQGRFTLDQLTTGSHYLFVIETEDGARAIVHNLRSGQRDLEFTVPARRDLVVTITGDTSKLHKRRGKPYIVVRQRVDFSPLPKMRNRQLLGGDTPIELTATGGTAIFRGLAVDLKPGVGPQRVAVRLGYDKQTMKTVELNLAGNTEVQIDLPTQSDSEIVGRMVHLATGKPVVGATIACGAVITDSGRRGGSNSVTDSQGRYRLTVAWPGIYNVWLKKFDQGPLMTAAADDGILVEADEVAKSELFLVKGRKVTGKVVDSDGQPFAQVGVNSYSAARPSSGGIQSVKTKEDGSFEFSLPPGRAYLYLNPGELKADDNSSGTYLSAHAHVNVTKNGAIEPITFIPEPRNAKFGDPEWLRRSTPGSQIVRREGNQNITGTVVDESGKPIVGAKVFRHDGPIMTTNDQGEFLLETHRGVQLIAHAFMPGYHLWTGTPTSGDVLRIVLEPKTPPTAATEAPLKK